MIAALVCGCETPGLIRLQRDIASAFPGEGIRVSIANGSALTVAFIGSRQVDLTPAQTEDFCRKVAIFVRDHYSGYERLDRVLVTLVTRQQRGLVGVTTGQTPCGFATEDLSAPEPTSQSK